MKFQVLLQAVEFLNLHQRKLFEQFQHCWKLEGSFESQKVVNHKRKKKFVNLSKKQKWTVLSHFYIFFLQNLHPKRTRKSTFFLHSPRPGISINTETVGKRHFSNQIGSKSLPVFFFLLIRCSSWFVELLMRKTNIITKQKQAARWFTILKCCLKLLLLCSSKYILSSLCDCGRELSYTRSL